MLLQLLLILEVEERIKRAAAAEEELCIQQR